MNIQQQKFFQASSRRKKSTQYPVSPTPMSRDVSILPEDGFWKHGTRQSPMLHGAIDSVTSVVIIACLVFSRLFMSMEAVYLYAVHLTGFQLIESLEPGRNAAVSTLSS